jgi:Tfp pilus assembly protein PilX
MFYIISNRKNLQQPLACQQRGVALLVALAFLVVITVTGLGTMRSSVVELRMASIFEDAITARQVSQSAIDTAINVEGNFIVTGTSGTSKSNADITAIAEASDVTLTIIESVTTLPPRGLGVSVSKFSATTFAINSAYNGVASGRGQSTIAQGMVLLVPKI